MSTATTHTALITGATRGMGRAIAERMAQQGFHLFLTARNTEALETLRAQLEREHHGIIVRYYPCDLADELQVCSLIKWISETVPTLDVLINNAGIFRAVSILNETDADFRDQLNLNYRAPHLICRAIGRLMRDQRRGHIINITSIASREPVPEAGSYTVTKYALMGLTHVLREELRGYGVHVTEIIPGSTLTSSWEGTDIPAERFVQVGDIADAVVLCLQVSNGANVDEIRIKPRQGNI